MSVTVKIDGLQALEAALRGLGDAAAASAAARAAVPAALEPTAKLARAAAPDDPADGVGKYLREAIKVSKARRKGDVVTAVLGIDESVDEPKQVGRKSGKGSYRDPGVAGVGPIIHFGRTGVAPVPFMSTAWDADKLELGPRLGAVLGPEIEKQAERLAKKRARGA